MIKDFISITDKSTDPTVGKYSSKKNSFYEDIKKWQSNKYSKELDIRPIQFTFEITNKCNCNCKDCGMAANRIETIRTVIEEDELNKLVDDLEIIGIPAFAITGGEPFLAFDKMCSMINHSRGKVDVSKIISNGFWGKNVEYYFKKLEESGLFENQFFVPSLQISIGQQTVPFEYICNIINYVSNHYSINELEQELIEVLDKKKIPYYSCIKELNIYSNKLYFLNTREYDNENDNNNVIYTEINDYKFMFMGDAGVEKEKDILEKYNISNIDVLKVGHLKSRNMYTLERRIKMN